MPDLSSDWLASDVWMTRDQLYSQYDVITPSNGPIEIMFTGDSKLNIMGNSSNVTINVKEKDSFYIVGRDNSARTNSVNEYIIRNSDGKYASVYLNTDYARVIDDDGNTYDNSAHSVQGQFSNKLGFLDPKAFNTFVGDSQAVIDNIRNENRNSANRTVDFSFENNTTSFGERLVVPSASDMQVSVVQHRMEPTIWAYGLPPQWTKYVDPRVMGFTTCEGSGNQGPRINVGLGRKYTEVIVSNPTILEIAPGFMKYAKWILGNSQMIDHINDLNTGADESAVQSLVAEFDEHSSKFYKIVPCFNDSEYSMAGALSSNDFKFGGYISYVTYLMVIAAVFLSREEVQRTTGSTSTGDLSQTTFKKFYSYGTSEDVEVLGDRKLPQNCGVIGGVYKRINWQYYNKHSGYLTIGGTIIGGAFGGADNNDTSSNAHQTAFDYMKFYLSGSTSASDNFSTSVEDSMLGQLASTINMATKEAAYWLASPAGDVLSSITSAVQGAFDAITLNGSNPLSGIFNINEMLGGGKIVFPQIITDSKYGKSIECECTFASIYGDEEAMYINTIMPYMHLLAFVLPHQVRTSLEMYTFPFLVKAFCRGLFNVEMGAITNFSVQRGGSDNALWSFNGAAEIVTVNFEITPLINNLVMTSTYDGPGWLLKNSGLQEYMSAITAFDARNDNFDLGVEIYTSAFGASVRAKAANILTPLLQSEFVSAGSQVIRQLDVINNSPMDIVRSLWSEFTSPINSAQVPPNTNINDYDQTGQSQGLIGGNNNILGG